ncbi:MAG TPA: beta-N-acetylhexosaminidase [Lachnospiraceae bacterium]|nr:beta-N-acetylhexosaminidase [Lachnospiraceae bacterium]
MDSRNEQQQRKREDRKKRRIRNQIIVYIVMAFLILALAAGIVFGVSFLLKGRKDGQQKEQQEAQQSQQQESLPDEQQEKQDMIDGLLADEEEIAVTPEPTPEVVEPTPQERLDEIVNAGIEAMSLEDKVAGLFFVTPEDITGVSAAVQAGEGTRDALAQYAVGGLVYFAKNIQSEQQLREMLENTKQYANYPVFLGVDEEGGTVARIGRAGIGPEVDAAGDIGATGDTQNAYNAGAAIGSALAGLGFNVDFAPVADLANVDGSIMEGRAYGSDAGTAAGFVAAMVRGLEEQNVTACLKHFPGMGSSVQDPHDGLSSSDRTEEQFRSEELSVFQAGIDAGAKMIMVGHMAAPALTGDSEPCIFSRHLVTDILREEMGYDGVIITDALSMSAISEYYGADEAAIMAVLAGCDMLLMPEDFGKAYNGILQAVADGNISEERIDDSLRRIYRIKYADMIEQ